LIVIENRIRWTIAAEHAVFWIETIHCLLQPLANKRRITKGRNGEFEFARSDLRQLSNFAAQTQQSAE
jgi:hypothetical protein